MKRIARSPISVVAIALICFATPAAAHSGHGNTLTHAVMHFLENSGTAVMALLLTVLLLAVFVLAKKLIGELAQKKDRK